MIKEYQISNFKPFAGAATIPIRPITLIFGANSSGKSSIIQSLLLLKQTIDRCIPDFMTTTSVVESDRMYLYLWDR